MSTAAPQYFELATASQGTATAATGRQGVEARARRIGMADTADVPVFQRLSKFVDLVRATPALDIVDAIYTAREDKDWVVYLLLSRLDMALEGTLADCQRAVLVEGVPWIEFRSIPPALSARYPRTPSHTMLYRRAPS